jgi:pimeloyl-[acyl-carrier protein] synthase
MDLQWNPLDAEFQANPYSTYHALRASAPIVWVDLPFEALPGMWLLTRYGDAVGVLHDERFSAHKPNLLKRAAGGALDRMISRNLLVLDPPDHTRIRTLVTKAFTPRVVEQLRPRIETVVAELLRARLETGTIDLIADLAAPLPVIVIAELLGIPIDDRARFKQWSDDLAVIADGSIAIAGLPQAEVAAGALYDYLDGVFAARRAAPGDDLVSGLVQVQEHGERLSRDELFSICTLLLIAGHETTTNLIGNGTLALLRHPDQLARLREDPSLMRNAVEELLRYDSPVQLTSRTALEDVVIDSTTIARGQEAEIIIGAANRDPAVFADPDRLDIGRRDVRHLSFGHGIHFCLGAALARLEAQIAIGAVVERLADLRLATDAPPWRPGIVLHGLAALPLAFAAHSAARATA